uniref:Uncharacterized protein n=1 Tax=Scleropages formosus TaxID=113540 RepID=A0A8C9RPK4_SCLFO
MFFPILGNYTPIHGTRSPDFNGEMVTLRTVAMQNHLALDYLLATQSWMCTVFGSRCCSYILENSEHIAFLADHIRETSALFHDFKQHKSGLLCRLSSLLVS